MLFTISDNLLLVMFYANLFLLCMIHLLIFWLMKLDELGCNMVKIYS